MGQTTADDGSKPIMHAAIVEVGTEGNYCAVKFLTREAADQWAQKNDAEILGWAPLMSLADAAELGHVHG